MEKGARQGDTSERVMLEPAMSQELFGTRRSVPTDNCELALASCLCTFYLYFSFVISSLPRVYETS